MTGRSHVAERQSRARGTDEVDPLGVERPIERDGGVAPDQDDQIKGFRREQARGLSGERRGGLARVRVLRGGGREHAQARAPRPGELAPRRFVEAPRNDQPPPARQRRPPRAEAEARGEWQRQAGGAGEERYLLERERAAGRDAAAPLTRALAASRSMWRDSVSTTATSATTGAAGQTVTGTGALPAKSVPASQAPVRSSAMIVRAIGPPTIARVDGRFTECEGILSVFWDRDHAHPCGAGISQKLALTAVVAVAGAVVGVVLVAAVRPAPEHASSGPAVARRAEEAPTGAQTPAQAALKPRKGRVLSVADAAKELDLIAPSRQKLAEDFTLPLVGGDKLRLSAARGKVVFINFWATWCLPCREEMPAMERLWQQQKGQGLVLVAVSVDTDTKKVKPYLDEHKLTFPVGLDPKMDLANAYGVRAVPSSFVVDRQGHLTAIALGPREWDNDASHSLIEGLLRSR